jgi:hypothetical protein
MGRTACTGTGCELLAILAVGIIIMNVPVVYMERYVRVIVLRCGQDPLRGALEELGPGNPDSLGP